jgi:hypothetical protein
MACLLSAALVVLALPSTTPGQAIVVGAVWLATMWSSTTDCRC